MEADLSKTLGMRKYTGAYAAFIAGLIIRIKT